MWIGDDAQRIEEVLEPDAVAGGAGTRRAVEREHLGLEPGHAIAALRTGLARGEQGFTVGARRLVCFVRRQAHGAAGEFERRLERLGQPLRRVRPDAQPVHHRLDGVFLLRVDLRQAIELVRASVDTHAHESLTSELLEHFRVFAFAIDDDRREQQNRQAVRHLHDLVDHLADSLCREVDAMIGTACDAGAREQQT
jgi:hypothetical protein